MLDTIDVRAEIRGPRLFSWFIQAVDQDAIKAHAHHDVVILNSSILVPRARQLQIKPSGSWDENGLHLTFDRKTIEDGSDLFSSYSWVATMHQVDVVDVFSKCFSFSTRNTVTLSKFRRYCNWSLRTWWFPKYLLTRTSMKDSCYYICDKVHHIITNQASPSS